MTAHSGATKAEIGNSEVGTQQQEDLMMEGSSRRPHRYGAKYFLHRARLTAQDCISLSEVILQVYGKER